MMRRCLPFVLLAGLLAVPTMRGQDADDADRKIIADAKATAESVKNLTYLCDEIGPRLTGSKNLLRANEWAAKKMKEYGLTNVHQEPWELPEGWERGMAEARLVEPNTGVRISIASYGWYPGTKGKITGDVVVLKLTSSKDLENYKGKLKGAIVLARPPVKNLPPDDLDRPTPMNPMAMPPMRPTEDQRLFLRDLGTFLASEGAAALFVDSAKPYGLLVTTGGWMGRDRPSAGNRIPQLFCAHHHYELLYRLGSRAEGKTRIELEVKNEFVPGPLAVNNTVGEIRGSEKPDEFVIVGAHLDSWDLALGATDNGTGSCTVLESARLLVKSGAKPKRTIRFVLFTGEEQGLHGSRNYCEQHKAELTKMSACLVHDTGTGKIVGIDGRHRPVLQPILAKELAGLKELGVANFDGAFIGGSDHASFDRAGVPGLMFRQEGAGYRMNHHTQIDGPDRVVEANLVQGAQVMAVSALRIANLDNLLPRDRIPDRKKGPGKEEKKDPEKKEVEKK